MTTTDLVMHAAAVWIGIGFAEVFMTTHLVTRLGGQQHTREEVLRTLYDTGWVLAIFVLTVALRGSLAAGQAVTNLVDFKVKVGQTVVVPLRVLGVGDANAFDFTLRYAPTAVELGDVVVPVGCLGLTGPKDRHGTAKVSIACVSGQSRGTLVLSVPVKGMVAGYSILSVWDCEVMSLTAGHETQTPCLIVGARVVVTP